jgi:hypothetical protein
VAHCPVEELDDLSDLLDVIRTWPGVREPTPCVFYVRRTPFLHFHINREGRRWADARAGGSWGTEIEIPRNATAEGRSRFLREVQRRYRATAKASGLP